MLIPAKVIALYGGPPEPHAILNIQFFASALLAWGLIVWFAKDFQEWAAVGGVLIGQNPAAREATRIELISRKSTMLGQMSFLGWPAEEKLTRRRRQFRRRGVALALLEEFGHAFPEITYDLLWDSPTINAQAWRVGTVRHVTVYGGLVRHAAVTQAGLALMIAHETGHHLGGLPRDPEMRWMTWQGQADYWAARMAMPLVFGSRAHDTTLRGARQILKLHDDLFAESNEPDLSPRCRYFIFRAGASGSEIPPCARAEYQRSFGREYPRDQGF